MSTASGSGAPPPAGVVCNSALTFVASAQTLPTENNTPPPLQDSKTQMNNAEPLMPPGLKALCDVCSKLYPDQPNPLQVTTRLKYWLGGEDPLDYISMYWNPGKPEEHIPPHWHFISFGLSDLHGDGRVHTRSEESGYGFELTFRVRGEGPPPLWPPALMQRLARYVFITGNRFAAGDHISWGGALDGAARGRVRHLLVAADPALRPAHTPHGRVQFLQMVGCTRRELRAAQRGSGLHALRAMREQPRCGGPYLVTDPARTCETPRPRAPSAPAPAPAELAGVHCRCSWLQKPKEESKMAVCVEQQIKDTLQRGLSAMSTDSQKGAVGHMSTDSFEMSSIGQALPQITDTQSTFSNAETVHQFDSVHVFIDKEGASLLPLALDGRIAHGHHFTWRSTSQAVTILAPEVSGAFVTERCAASNGWLQVIITPSLAAQLRRQFPSPASDRSDSDTDSDTDTDEPFSLTTDVISFTVTK